MPIRLPIDPPLVDVPVTQVLWRVHPRACGPIWFGPAAGNSPRGRFDAPGGEYGACYFGASLGVAILETVVRGRKVPIISRAELKLRAASSVSLAAPLRMLQLEGKGLASFGLSAHEVAGSDYTDCQELARRVHATRDDVDGIQFRSRWDTSELCWVLFDRAEAKLGGVPGTQRLDDPAVVRPALLPYRHLGVS